MRLNEESARRTAQQARRSASVDLRLGLVRDRARLPWRCDPSSAAEELSRAEIVHAANTVAGRAGAFLIGGGAALRRSDWWELLAELVHLRPDDFGGCSSGHGGTPAGAQRAGGEGVPAAVAQRLRREGVQRLHIPFHCARQDAHDWLVGESGALKVAHRAIRAALSADLPVVAEIVLTRPTMRHLSETIEVLARSGVRNICVRRLHALDVDGAAQFVPLSPRLELLGESLESAATLALERRVRLQLRALPLCVAPRLRPLFAAPESELWVLAGRRTPPRGAAWLCRRARAQW